MAERSRKLRTGPDSVSATRRTLPLPGGSEYGDALVVLASCPLPLSLSRVFPLSSSSLPFFRHALNLPAPLTLSLRSLLSLSLSHSSLLSRLTHLALLM